MFADDQICFCPSRKICTEVQMALSSDTNTLSYVAQHAGFAIPMFSKSDSGVADGCSFNRMSHGEWTTKKINTQQKAHVE